ncbi:MAG: hypothetical protein GXO31_05610 [Epsilonproteobacteria bacterium]|nr:hypothetical protein [Campylobacterota bacterium]
MLGTILSILISLVIGIILFVKSDSFKDIFAKFGIKDASLVSNLTKAIGVLIILLSILSTSFTYIDRGYTGHLVKKFLGKSLRDGKIIATKGELGRQAEILPEGLHFKPFLNIIYKVEKVRNIVIPPNSIGILTARDGEPLDDIVSKDWVEIVAKKDPLKVSRKERDEIFKKMLNAKYFIEHGGKKGPQLNVLKPGEYRLNQYLFSVRIKRAINIPAGFVGVVTSKTGDNYQGVKLSTAGDSLATPVVPKGYKGVWSEVLLPGTYYEYANDIAYKITPFDTRVKTWAYKGGFSDKEIEVFLTPDGKVAQKMKSRNIPVPKGVADKAIDIKSKDGWVVYVEARLQVQGEPKYAPKIVASVGSLEDMEDKVITPIFRSVLRNIGENKDAVEFLNHRSAIESEANRILKEEALKAGVTIKDLRISHINIPPALLVPKKRKQLAEQMITTYQEEQKAYEEQIKANKTKAEAEQQAKLVEAQIAKERAKELKEQKRLLGEGEKLYLEAVAKGQKAQADVLGKDKTYELQMWDRTLAFLKDHPDVIKNVPLVYINKASGNNGSGFEEGAAIFALEQIKKAQKNLSK